MASTAPGPCGRGLSRDSPSSGQKHSVLPSSSVFSTSGPVDWWPVPDTCDLDRHLWSNESKSTDPRKRKTVMTSVASTVFLLALSLSSAG